MFAFLKSLPLTFYSIPFYKALVNKGKGIGLGFLAIVVLVNLVTMGLLLAKPYMAFWGEEKALFEALPEVTVENGQLSMDAPSPKEIAILNQTEGGPLKILFDMNADSADVNALTKKMAEQNIVILATKDKIIIYDKSRNKPDISEVSTFSDTKVTHEKWMKIEKAFNLFFAPALALVLAFVLFAAHLLTAFAGAVLLLIIAPLFKLNPSFAAAMRLASAAKVPVAVFFLFLPPIRLMQLLLWFAFAAFGLLASRERPVKS